MQLAQRLLQHGVVGRDGNLGERLPGERDEPDAVRSAGPYELDRGLLGDVDAVRRREVFRLHAPRDVHGQHDGDPLAARFAARSADAGPRGGDDPGAEAGAAERDREARDPEAFRRARSGSDVAHLRAREASEALGAQPPPQRQQGEREQQQRAGEAHGVRSRASRRAMAESAATSVPWAEANATRSSCSSRSRSSRSGALGRTRSTVVRHSSVSSAACASGTARSSAARNRQIARAATAFGSPAASQRVSGTSRSTGTGGGGSRARGGRRRAATPATSSPAASPSPASGGSGSWCAARSGASSPCGLGARSESGITLVTRRLVVPPAVESARPSGPSSHTEGSASL